MGCRGPKRDEDKSKLRERKSEKESDNDRDWEGERWERKWIMLNFGWLRLEILCEECILFNFMLSDREK